MLKKKIISFQFFAAYIKSGPFFYFTEKRAALYVGSECPLNPIMTNSYSPNKGSKGIVPLAEGFGEAEPPQ